jgi:hypothetical protein
MNYHTGNLSGRIISASARCIIYDHKREVIHLSSDNRRLIVNVVMLQHQRDPDGNYRVYEFATGEWVEIPIERASSESST